MVDIDCYDKDMDNTGTEDYLTLTFFDQYLNKMGESTSVSRDKASEAVTDGLFFLSGAERTAPKCNSIVDATYHSSPQSTIPRLGSLYIEASGENAIWIDEIRVNLHYSIQKQRRIKHAWGWGDWYDDGIDTGPVDYSGPDFWFGRDGGLGWCMSTDPTDARAWTSRVDNASCHKQLDFRSDNKAYTRRNKPGSSANGFVAYPNSGIPGNNKETHSGISVQECQKLCLMKDWCKTVDYGRAAKACYLQQVDGSEATLKTNYKDNPYDHYLRTN